MKYQGILGVRAPNPVEIAPGIFDLVIDRIVVTGDVYPNKTSWPNASQSTTILNMILSILPPEQPDILVNEVVYAEFQGQKWSVVGIEYERPRIKLNLGGRYNGA